MNSVCVQALPERQRSYSQVQQGESCAEFDGVETEMGFVQNHAALCFQPHDRTIIWHVTGIWLTAPEVEWKAQPLIQPRVLNASGYGRVERYDDNLCDDLHVMVRLGNLENYSRRCMPRLEGRYLQSAQPVSSPVPGGVCVPCGWLPENTHTAPGWLGCLVSGMCLQGTVGV